MAARKKSRKKADKDKAVTALTDAAAHYRAYVGLVTANHIDQIWFNRVGILNWQKQISDVMADIEIAKELKTR